MSFVRSRRLVGVLTVAMAAGVGIAGTSSPSMAGPKGPLMDIQILSFNDFHGNLEPIPSTSSSGRIVTGHALNATGTAAIDVNTPAGGVKYLATHLRDARVGNPNTVTVAAGDIIGASPLLSAAFHDEPTIEAMNALGLEATAVGNHEFDEGYQELLRMQNGGCLEDGPGLNNQNSCATPVAFPGASFKILAANVKYAGKDKTILPPYWVKNFNGAKVGFIGMTLKGTPSIVTAAGVAGLQFTDEVETANALVPVLRAQGVKAIVVLVHQGGTPDAQKWTAGGTTYTVNPTYDYTCGGGGSLKDDLAIVPIAKGLDPQIDMIISGHTHQPYVCNVPDPNGSQRLVTSASSFGRLFTETNLTFDRRTQDIVRASVKGNNMIVTRDVPKAADETKIIDTYKTLIAPIANKELGNITADITRTQNPAGESTLGDLIADAQVNDPSVVTGGQKPVVAFMNPGGIRGDLTFAKSGLELVDGIVRYEEAFTVQPFNNYMVSMSLTGADIWALLEQQWPSGKILQVSKGLQYSWSATSTPKVSALTIDGLAVPKDATVYRIATNNFLADGGDNFLAFKKGTNVFFGGLDIDAFANYLPTVSPYTPLAPNRITKLP